MRVFAIQENGKFKEYVETPFHSQHEEAVLEDWLEDNPEGILEDGKLLIIGRQISTNLGGTIDLLGLDKSGHAVVVELKRDRTPRDTIAQAIEYASFVEQLNSRELEEILQSYLSDESVELAEYHRKYFELEPEDAVAFNKDQRLVVVGQQVSAQIRQTASFLRSKGIRVTCIEFSFFQAEGGTKLFTQQIVVGGEPTKPERLTSRSLPLVTQAGFLGSLDDNGRAAFQTILDFAADRSMPIHWGTRGFSLNVDLDGAHVVILFGYPPGCVYGQSIYTALISPGGISPKTAVPDETISWLGQEAESTGLFRPAGREFRCTIDRPLSQEETDAILEWCEKAAAAITEYGLNE